MNPNTRQQLEDALAQRILIIDGAMGTMLQAHNPTADDFGGAALENCNENLSVTRPDWIRDIHREYLKAGADIIETNSFQGSPIVLAEFGLASQTRELNVAAAQIARQAAAEFSTSQRPRFVAGSIGPTTKSLTLRGDVSFQQLRDSYYEQAKALVEGGVDFLLFETGFDTRNVKSGLVATQQLERELGQRIPVMVSGTVERWGAMLAGVAVGAVASISAPGLPGQVSYFTSIAPIAMAMGVPIAPLGMLIAIEPVPDMFRTVGNVTMDVAVAGALDRRSG